MSISKKLLHKLIVAGVIFRLFLMAFLYHPDLKSQYFHGQFLSQGIINIYDYLNNNRFKLGYSDSFNYPPLAYFFFGSQYSISHLLLGQQLTDWINDWGADHLYRPGIFLILLTLKFPYLLADLLLLYFLIKIETHNSKLITILWLYNPVSWYAIYITGQFDILPALTTVLCLFFIGRNKYLLAGFMLGLGAALKTYPILLLPGLFIIAPKLRDKFGLVAMGLGLWLLGFFILKGSLSSLQSGLVMSILSLGIPVSASQNILFYPLVYMLSLWLLYKNPNKIVWFFLVATISVITFSQFHFQWLLWSMPFFTIFVIKNKTLFIPVICFITFAFIHQFLLNDQYSLIALFSPINPNLAIIPSIPNLLMQLKFPIGLITTLNQTVIFTLGCFLMIKTYEIEI